MEKSNQDQSRGTGKQGMENAAGSQVGKEGHQHSEHHQEQEHHPHKEHHAGFDPNQPEQHKEQEHHDHPEHHQEKEHHKGGSM